MEDNPTSLKQIFQGMQTSELSLVEGAVIQVSPLLIKLTNDNLELNENVLIVPRFLTDWQVECDISVAGGSLSAPTGSNSHNHSSAGITNDGAHSHSLNNFQLSKGSIRIYNSLKKGEKVMLLSYNNGKKYYILDRV